MYVGAAVVVGCPARAGLSPGRHFGPMWVLPGLPTGVLRALILWGANSGRGPRLAWSAWWVDGSLGLFPRCPPWTLGGPWGALADPGGDGYGLWWMVVSSVVAGWAPSPPRSCNSFLT